MKRELGVRQKRYPDGLGKNFYSIPQKSKVDLRIRLNYEGIPVKYFIPVFIKLYLEKNEEAIAVVEKIKDELSRYGMKIRKNNRTYIFNGRILEKMFGLVGEKENIFEEIEEIEEI